MDYSHDGSGRAKVVGCAGFSATKNYLTLFAPRQRAWIKRKADLGIVESVVIKKVNTLSPESMVSEWGSEPEVTYTDTFNRVWLEDELTTHENAVDMARVWWENVAQHSRRMFEEGMECYPIRKEGCG